MTDITDAGPRLKAMNDRLDELRTAADQADAEYRAEIERLRLTDEERAAVDRARIAFRDMDHNAMTMQQLEDYEALCGLLERLGDTPDTHSTPTEGSEQNGCTLTGAERSAVGVAIQCVVASAAQRHPEEQVAQELLHKTASALDALLERLSPPAT